MKKLLITSLIIAWIFILTTTTLAQTPVNYWTRGIAQSGKNIKVVATETAANGDTYVLINANGSSIFVGFDTGYSEVYVTTQADDAYLVKYDKDGFVYWALKIQGTGNETANCMHVDIDENIFIGGKFNSPSVNFSGVFTITSSNTSGTDAFFAKYNASGTCLFANKIGGVVGSNYAINAISA